MAERPDARPFLTNKGPLESLKVTNYASELCQIKTAEIPNIIFKQWRFYEGRYLFTFLQYSFYCIH